MEQPLAMPHMCAALHLLDAGELQSNLHYPATRASGLS